MKNKNKYILGAILGIFLIGLVSAGITGYVLTRGDFLPQTSTQIESVDAGTSSIVVDGEKVSAGETFVRGGKSFEVVAVEEPSWFLGRPKVAIKEVTPSAKSLTTSTQTDCEENCQTFTEVYKVEEGQTISIGGDTISINFISATQVILDVNGQLTNLLSEDQKFELSNGQIVVVKNVAKLEVAGTIGFVELGVLSSYKLKEGQVINLQGDLISINFISATQVILDINGQLTDLLSEDNTFELSNGQIATIQDVLKLEVAGEIGWVVLDPSSCYFVF